MIVTCKQCGNGFQAARSSARFCSAKCKVRWNRQAVTVTPEPDVTVTIPAPVTPTDCDVTVSDALPVTVTPEPDVTVSSAEENVILRGELADRDERIAGLLAELERQADRIATLERMCGIHRKGARRPQLDAEGYSDTGAL